eukprot:g5317.t1
MTTIGTKYYCAPEVLANRRYDEKADVYSFGILLGEVMVRPLPVSALFQGMESTSVMLQVSRGWRPAIPDTYLSQFTPVRDLMVACWHPDPAARPSYADILRRLETSVEYVPAHHALTHWALKIRTVKSRRLSEAASNMQKLASQGDGFGPAYEGPPKHRGTFAPGESLERGASGGDGGGHPDGRDSEMEAKQQWMQQQQQQQHQEQQSDSNNPFARGGGFAHMSGTDVASRAGTTDPPVKVKYPAWSMLYDGTVHEVHDNDATFEVRFDDGEVKWDVTRAMLVEPPTTVVPPASAAATTKTRNTAKKKKKKKKKKTKGGGQRQRRRISLSKEALQPGTRVRVLLPEWPAPYEGCIRDVNRDASSFHVAFDDGEERWDVPAAAMMIVFDNDHEEGEEDEQEEEEEEEEGDKGRKGRKGLVGEDGDGSVGGAELRSASRTSPAPLAGGDGAAAAQGAQRSPKLVFVVPE